MGVRPDARHRTQIRTGLARVRLRAISRNIIFNNTWRFWRPSAGMHKHSAVHTTDGVPVQAPRAMGADDSDHRGRTPDDIPGSMLTDIELERGEDCRHAERPTKIDV